MSEFFLECSDTEKTIESYNKKRDKIYDIIIKNINLVEIFKVENNDSIISNDEMCRFSINSNECFTSYICESCSKAVLLIHPMYVSKNGIRYISKTDRNDYIELITFNSSYIEMSPILNRFIQSIIIEKCLSKYNITSLKIEMIYKCNLNIVSIINKFLTIDDFITKYNPDLNNFYYNIVNQIISIILLLIRNVKFIGMITYKNIQILEKECFIRDIENNLITYPYTVCFNMFDCSTSINSIIYTSSRYSVMNTNMLSVGYYGEDMNLLISDKDKYKYIRFNNEVSLKIYENIIYKNDEFSYISLYYITMSLLNIQHIREMTNLNGKLYNIYHKIWGISFELLLKNIEKYGDTKKSLVGILMKRMV